MHQASTMGFVPEVQRSLSEWLSPTGQQQFLNIVRIAVRDKYGVDDVEIANPQELLDILQDAIRIRGDGRDVIKEVVAYCVQLCLGRLELDNRLQSIRDNPIRNMCRGGYDRKKGCLPFTDKKQSLASSYNAFLQTQQQYRN